MFAWDHVYTIYVHYHMHMHVEQRLCDVVCCLGVSLCQPVPSTFAICTRPPSSHSAKQHRHRQCAAAQCARGEHYASISAGAPTTNQVLCSTRRTVRCVLRLPMICAQLHTLRSARVLFQCCYCDKCADECNQTQQRQQRTISYVHMSFCYRSLRCRFCWIVYKFQIIFF